MKDIPVGTTGEKSVRVTPETLASRAGSGAVEVFSTPNLVLLMEQAAMEAINPYLDQGETSVGTLVNIRHLAATPLDLVVTARATVTEIDRRRLVFHVEAHDGIEKVGEGTHERFVLQRDRFISKTSEKSTRRTANSVE